MMEIRFISYNVNGINSAVKKGVLEYISSLNADLILLQEVKAGPDTIDPHVLNFPGYQHYWNPAEKKGHHGVLTYCKNAPIQATNGINIPEFDTEGRILTLEYPQFFIINAYLPNAGRGLPRLGFKLKFNHAFFEYCQRLRQTKPVIIGGDLNVAHTELDIRNPRQNIKNAGFTPEERQNFTEFLKLGYFDTFRMFTQEGGHYTWWSQRSDAKARNIGWRLDYFVVSKELEKNVFASKIHRDADYADHVPVELILTF
jgi:exodeoxyribonuclease-3